MKCEFLVDLKLLEQIKFLLEENYVKSEETKKILNYIVDTSEFVFSKFGVSHKYFNNFDISAEIFDEIKLAVLKVRKDTSDPFFMFCPNNLDERLFEFHIKEEHFSSGDKLFFEVHEDVEMLAKKFSFKNVGHFLDLCIFIGFKFLLVNYKCKSDFIKAMREEFS